MIVERLATAQCLRSERGESVAVSSFFGYLVVADEQTNSRELMVVETILNGQDPSGQLYPTRLCVKRSSTFSLPPVRYTAME